MQMANVFDRAHAFWDLDGGFFDLLLGIFGLILFFLGAKGPVSSSCCLLLLGVVDAMMIECDEPLFLCCCSEIMKSWNSSIAADLMLPL